MTRKIIMSLFLFLASTVAPLWAVDFDHDAHVEEYVVDADCATCHVSEADSIIPKTDICLECHDAELIDEIVLPETKTHGPIWSLNHGPVAKGNAIDCASCHEQSSCLDCHKAGFANEMGDLGNNMNNVHRSDFSVTHPLAARSGQNRCNSCHEARFCSDCHDAWQFKTDDIGSPSHRRTFDLGIEDADIDVIHAGINSSLSCDTCHSSASMDFHSWSIGHAREARRSLASCQACHPEGDACLRCHSARGGAIGFNPHPKDWDDIKGNISDASNGKTCRKCH
ncbi:hypothetical protein SAMN05660420_00224 [Desulfuromusa kysingii]|uniref:Uncharacterized protein n=1 Tax=Desulfuromusa kysingii TaxID=37625 RepID=A0A1H3VQX0_9BACT|nr:cytochrome c3 family protein [Desulfuromusa kysingii]SDZ77091.1 hypothetical protein SAMN05660420_00224 [Desulfuromusa kysingii]